MLRGSLGEVGPQLVCMSVWLLIGFSFPLQRNCDQSDEKYNPKVQYLKPLRNPPQKHQIMGFTQQHDQAAHLMLPDTLLSEAKNVKFKLFSGQTGTA